MFKITSKSKADLTNDVLVQDAEQVFALLIIQCTQGLASLVQFSGSQQYQIQNLNHCTGERRILIKKKPSIFEYYYKVT